MDDIYESTKNTLGVFLEIKSVALTKEELCHKLSSIIAPRLKADLIKRFLFLIIFIYLDNNS